MVASETASSAYARKRGKLKEHHMWECCFTMRRLGHTAVLVFSNQVQPSNRTWFLCCMEARHESSTEKVWRIATYPWHMAVPQKCIRRVPPHLSSSFDTHACSCCLRLSMPTVMPSTFSGIRISRRLRGFAPRYTFSPADVSRPCSP